MYVNEMEEKDLFECIARGDESAFRLIFDRYRQPFYFAALKMTRSANVFEEIVQDVFVTLWQYRAVLAKVQQPSAYLNTIVYNHIRRHFRKLAMERQLKENLSQQIIQAECMTETLLAEKETNLLLQELIAHLPPRQQLIYRLSRQEGYSRDEIAKRLNLSPNTVKNHLLKALKYIRLHFSETLSLVIFLFIAN